MRSFLRIAVILLASTSLYKYRYRLLNGILAVGFLRKIAVRLSMNIPQIRTKILPSLFQSQSK